MGIGTVIICRNVNFTSFWFQSFSNIINPILLLHAWCTSSCQFTTFFLVPILFKHQQPNFIATCLVYKQLLMKIITTFTLTNITNFAACLVVYCVILSLVGCRPYHIYSKTLVAATKHMKILSCLLPKGKFL